LHYSADQINPEHSAKMGRPSESRASETGILQRFLHLLSAQSVEGIGTAVFFVYLARLDTVINGEIMYAMAAGNIVMKIVQFGLYYPLVSELGNSKESRAPEIINRVNVIKILLLMPTLLILFGILVFKALTWRLIIVVILVSLGFALEALADTLFADLRVRGRQPQEARIKIAASTTCYLWGLGSAALGLHPILISLFKVLSGGIRTLAGAWTYSKIHSGKLFFLPDAHSAWLTFRAALVFAVIEILGIFYNKTNIFFLEDIAGVKGVAYYSATWNIVDSISILGSEQLLAWVVFPLLATTWFGHRDTAVEIIRGNARWLFALALPIVFVLHVEADTMIPLIYGPEYADAIWMQRYLAWTIPISFENNLYAYVMMVAGASTALLKFAAVATILNLIYNLILVKYFGMAGVCLVIVLTKLTMLALTFTYCQLKFRFFQPRDLIFPLAPAAAILGLYVLTEPLLTLHGAAIISLFKPIPLIRDAVLFLTVHGAAIMGVAVYCLVLWRFGPKHLGRFARKGT
jgi:O-antigen/teichoic acid export membrane protein